MLDISHGARNSMPRHTIHLPLDAEGVLQELAVAHHGNLSETIATALVRYAARTKSGPELLRASIIELGTRPSAAAQERLAASLALTVPQVAAGIITEALADLRDQLQFSARADTSLRPPRKSGR